MRPEARCLSRKVFPPASLAGAAQLFTGGSGEPCRALLTTGGITVETVSAARGAQRRGLCRLQLGAPAVCIDGLDSFADFGMSGSDLRNL